MSKRALIGLFVAAVLLTALVVTWLGNALHDAEVRDYRERMRIQHEADSLQDLRVAAAKARDDSTIAAHKDSLARVEAELAAWKRRRAKVDTLVLPDTGSVPVVVVRAAQEMWQAQLAIADSSLLASERVNTELHALVDSYDRILVTRTNELVAEHESRLKWEHIAKSAPVKQKKWLGFIPPPSVVVGAQAGIGACTGSSSPCGYGGGGITVGWKL